MPSGNPSLLRSLNHSPVKEYRVTKDGKIEARLLDCGSEQERDWREVPPAQLCNHVRRNTAVARWLERIWVGDDYCGRVLVKNRSGWKILLNNATVVSPESKHSPICSDDAVVPSRLHRD